MVSISLFKYDLKFFLQLLRQVIIFLLIHWLVDSHPKFEGQSTYLVLVIGFEIVEYFLAYVAGKFRADGLALSHEFLSIHGVFVGEEVRLQLIQLESFAELYFQRFYGLSDQWHVDLLPSWVDYLLPLCLLLWIGWRSFECRLILFKFLLALSLVFLLSVLLRGGGCFV